MRVLLITGDPGKEHTVPVIDKLLEIYGCEQCLVVHFTAIDELRADPRWEKVLAQPLPSTLPIAIIDGRIVPTHELMQYQPMRTDGRAPTSLGLPHSAASGDNSRQSVGVPYDGALLELSDIDMDDIYFRLHDPETGVKQEKKRTRAWTSPQQLLFGKQRTCVRASDLYQWVCEHIFPAPNQVHKALHLCYQLRDRYFSTNSPSPTRAADTDITEPTSNELYYFLADDDPSILNGFRRLLTQPSSAQAIVSEVQRHMHVICKQYISADGMEVDYERIRSSNEFRHYLASTVSLQQLNLGALTEHERRAFLLNLYNGLVIHASLVFKKGSFQGKLFAGDNHNVLATASTASATAPATAAIEPSHTSDGVTVRTRSALDRAKFFANASYNIGGNKYSLNDIEHGLLRGNRRPPGRLGKCFASSTSPPDPRLPFVLPLDPRIHFALVCGAKSCPAIRIFEASTLDEDLQRATENFLEHEVEVDEATRTVRLSRLFQWYGGDFGSSKLDMLRWIVRNLRRGSASTDTKREQLERIIRESETRGERFHIKFSKYNWELNNVISFNKELHKDLEHDEDKIRSAGTALLSYLNDIDIDCGDTPPAAEEPVEADLLSIPGITARQLMEHLSQHSMHPRSKGTSNRCDSRCSCRQLVTALGKSIDAKAKADLDSAAQSLLTIFIHNDRAIDLLHWAILEEVSSYNRPATLFRDDTLRNKLIGRYFQMVARPYIQFLLRPLVEKIASGKLLVDVSTVNDKARKAMQRLLAALQQVVDALAESLDLFPFQLRVVCHLLQRAVDMQFSGSKLCEVVVGSLIFLRLVCPAIIVPESQGLLPAGTVNEAAKATLKQVAKILQRLANGSAFAASEPFADDINKFLEANHDKVAQCFGRLAFRGDSGSPRTAEPSGRPRGSTGGSQSKDVALDASTGLTGGLVLVTVNAEQAAEAVKVLTAVLERRLPAMIAHATALKTPTEKRENAAAEQTGQAMLVQEHKSLEGHVQREALNALPSPPS